MKIKLNKNKTNCPICFSNKFEIILQQDRFWFNIKTTVCEKCGLVMFNPLPEKSFLDNFYIKYYRKYYESTETPNEEYFLKFIWRASKRINYISKYLKNDINYLDIWSADGSYLWLIKQFYKIKETWIEPNNKYSQYSIEKKWLNIINDIYENTNLKDNQYDIISHFHVLEHIYDINHFINFNYKKLINNGILYIEVPNILWDWAWIWMIHLWHLYNFSEKSLTNLLIQNWFIIEKKDISNDEIFWPIIRIVAKKIDNSVNNNIIKENYKEIKRHIINNVNKISKLEFLIIQLSKNIIWDTNTKKLIKKVDQYVKRK